MESRTEIAEALGGARRALLAARDPRGHWRGELSSSALSTATAVIARAVAAAEGEGDELRALANAGRRWLASNAGADGGFGDTVESPSNLSTTALAWAALGPLPSLDVDDGVRAARTAAEAWLERALDGAPVTAARLASALEAIYGKDRTFAVPILTACAIADAFEGDGDPWRHVRRLPFELAALPQGLFRFVGLPVVSYALPALVAIGQVVESRRPNRNPLTKSARLATRARTLSILDRIQPSNGGFLEATPLTSFVTMSLVAAGEANHVVVERALGFLRASVRDDGSWPIDTDLATWGTTLAINALGGELDGADADVVRRWLLDQQHRERHPYTGAAPGGWAWTDLPGGVPDADDTPGALLALRRLEANGSTEETRRAAEAALGWLCDLQNRDGGIPTFCRGWAELPFDRSCADLSAHALRAFEAWEGEVGGAVATRLRTARERAVRFLVRTQSSDGSWVPLWFGNQHEAEKLNPVYGTSRVLLAAHVGPGGELDGPWRAALASGHAWLCSAQSEDGGFGGAPGVPPSIEETGLALEALVHAHEAGLGDDENLGRIERAALWLASATRGGTTFPRTPIGLYFAQLWYHEALYPVAFTVSALRGAERVLGAAAP
ncbi:MAG: prenyltransferase/squalene oxidase repeat-containing protein [Planctomycetota bacterium]